MRAVKKSRTRDNRKHALLLTIFVVTACSLSTLPDRAHGGDDVVTPQITVDQFGWLPRARKVAILADPVKGQNAGQTYRPGPVRDPSRSQRSRGLSRREWRWNGPGQRAGRRPRLVCRFQRPACAGLLLCVRSHQSRALVRFRIGEDVYEPVLRDAVRVFDYQRSGMPITEQHGGVWHHPGGHLGKDQDRAARFAQGGKALGRPRNVLRRLVRCGRPEQVRPYLGRRSSICSGRTSSIPGLSATTRTSPSRATACPTCSTR